MGLSLCFIAAKAQVEGPVDQNTTRRLTKEEKRQLKSEEEAQRASLVQFMVEKRQFVLEANYVSGRSGERTPVSSSLNFVVIDSSRVTMQLASVSGVGGYNGMGGITVDGTITRYDVKMTGRNKNVYAIEIYLNTRFGHYDMLLQVSPYGNADARIGGNWGGKLNYHGMLVPVWKSKVYKGPVV